MELTKQFTWNGLKISTPADWLDETEEEDQEDGPFSLGKEEGISVLQFMPVVFGEDAPEEIRPEHLNELVEEFLEENDFAPLDGLHESYGAFMTAYTDTRDDEYFVRAWMCTNGTEVVLVTYYCEFGDHEAELAEAIEIVRALEM